MRSHLPTRRRRNRSGSSLCRCRKFLRVAIEPLEDRVMLDGGVGASNSLPPAIVVGRTLSSYFVGGVQNNQETITYTVYNEQADPETGVLADDDAGTGRDASSETPRTRSPIRAARTWPGAWGRSTGYDRASVTLTVALASPSPDAARLRCAGVRHARRRRRLGRHARRDAAARAAVPTPACSPPRPTPTPPTRSSRKRRPKLDYDPQQIFDFLHTQIGYNSYTGSVRGARGTLWSSAAMRSTSPAWAWP